MTIHITPEAGYSYVSFETNYPQSSYAELVGRILKTFLPGQFIVTLLANEVSCLKCTLRDCLCFGLVNNALRYVDHLQASIASGSNKLDFKLDSIHAYHRKEMQFSRVKNYDLTYGLFAKAPS